MWKSGNGAQQKLLLELIRGVLRKKYGIIRELFPNVRPSPPVPLPPEPKKIWGWKYEIFWVIWRVLFISEVLGFLAPPSPMLGKISK